MNDTPAPFEFDALPGEQPKTAEASQADTGRRKRGPRRSMPQVSDVPQPPQAEAAPAEPAKRGRPPVTRSPDRTANVLAAINALQALEKADRKYVVGLFA